MKIFIIGVAMTVLTASAIVVHAADKNDELEAAIKADYDAHLGDLFEHFHANPELSFVETKTAARLAKELSDAGFEVTAGVGRTGIVRDD